MAAAAGSELGKINAASHPHAPPALITNLASRDEWMVRRSVAANPATPPELVRLLEQDPDDLVSEEALKRPDRRPGPG